MSYLEVFKAISEAAKSAGWSRSASQPSVRYGQSVYWTSPDGAQIVELDHGTGRAQTYPASARVGDRSIRTITSWAEVEG